MPSTTIHFPEKILKKLDEAARDHGISRNRYVLHACEKALEKEEGHWPSGFFKLDIDEEDQTLLRSATQEMEREIYANRRNRGAPIL